MPLRLYMHPLASYCWKALIALYETGVPFEQEIVDLVIAGCRNREISERLSISEKTVKAHLSNIFAKLDVPSRTAAAAYAFDHGLT